MNEPREDKYYNWRKTLSYDAHVTFVMSSRGLGKTYGLRKQCINDFIKHGYRFAELVRYKNEIEGEDAMQDGYFDKIELNNEFPDYIFKTLGKHAYIAKKPKTDDEKPDWQLIGYFVALSTMQKTKKKTYANVKRIIFDECIIDKRTTSRYLPGEFDLFSNAIDSLLREDPDNLTVGRVYLLGNSCDLTNPYLSHWKIRKEPKAGYSWHDGKLTLIHYCKDKVYSAAKKNTLVGRLVAGTTEERVIVDNEFARSSGKGFIFEKPKNAKFAMGVVYLDKKFGIWEDEQEGYYYVNKKIPKNTRCPVFTLTNSDNDPNYIMASRMNKTMRSFVNLYYEGIVRYDTSATCEEFLRALSLFGVR